MKRLFRLIRNARVLAAVILAIGTASVAMAQTAQEPTAAPDDRELEVTVAGQQVSIDPKTGKLRQLTAEEARALSQAFGDAFRRNPVMVTESSDGMLIAELPESYDEVAVVTINADGSLSVKCVTGMEAASQLLESEAPSPEAAITTAPPATAKPVVKKASGRRASPAVSSHKAERARAAVPVRKAGPVRSAAAAEKE